MHKYLLTILQRMNIEGDLENISKSMETTHLPGILQVIIIRARSTDSHTQYVAGKNIHQTKTQANKHASQQDSQTFLHTGSGSKCSQGLEAYTSCIVTRLVLRDWRYEYAV